MEATPVSAVAIRNEAVELLGAPVAAQAHGCR